MRVVVAPDSFGGTLGPVAAAEAIAAGWLRGRPADDVVALPLSDGGEGLLDALRAGPLAGAELRVADVADAAGLATDASWLLHDDLAVIESAQACGLSALRADRRDPRRTTTWGVGQLLDAARCAGARRILVGLGGSATVDGGAGALSGLGFRLTVEDGSGLKIGGEDLPRVAGATRTWVGDWEGLEVELLADVRDPLTAAPRVYGPQKGAGPQDVAHLEAGLGALRRVLERDLGAAPAFAASPGTGAAGGLAYGLAVGLDARLRPGAEAVAELVGLDAALVDADLVLTGEGRLDATSTRGKVVGAVHDHAALRGVPVALVVGQLGEGAPRGDVEVAAPGGAGPDPAAEVADAAARLAGRWRQPLR